MALPRIAASLFFAAPLLALAACSSAATVDGPPAPSGGWLTLQLTTPRADDGAVQFSVNGPGIDSVKIVGYDGFATIDGSGANLLVTGNVTGGDVARIHVTDLSNSSRLQTIVAAAAARQSYSLQVLDGYRAVLIR